MITYKPLKTDLSYTVANWW